VQVFGKVSLCCTCQPLLQKEVVSQRHDSQTPRPKAGPGTAIGAEARNKNVTVMEEWSREFRTGNPRLIGGRCLRLGCGILGPASGVAPRASLGLLWQRGALGCGGSFAGQVITHD